MTIPIGYDFADHLVRELVTTSHVPLEQVEITMGGTTIRPLVCEKCHSTWPCTIIVGLRNYLLDTAPVGLKTSPATDE